ncbi:MAG: hypothetical protein HZA92_01160 [Verrucomicrobia bacterium]|nr:hypothetical protein [Verrucomicrobiota bacterium]
MKSLFKSLLVATVATAILIASPATVSAQDKEKAKEKGKEKAAEKAKKDGVTPFNGKAAAVDKAAKTVKLSGEKARVIQITGTTRIVKGGNPATLDDLKEGEDVSGGFKTSADGKMEATVLNIGPRPPAKGKDKKDDKKEEKK